MSFKFIGLALALFLVIGFAGQAMATIASSEQSERVCRNLLSYIVNERGGWADSDSPKIDKIRDIMVNDTLLGRCYDIAPSGYVIVPVLMEQSPIKACSDVSAIDFDGTEGFGAMIRDVLAYQARLYVSVNGGLDVGQVNKTHQVFDPSGRQQWEIFLLDDEAFLSQLTAKGAKSADDVGPLMTSIWDQNAPYNYFCPYGDGGRTVVGCVSTAASQILRYHQWPPEGQGSRSYYWEGDYSCGGSSAGATLSADFSDPYDWENMPNNCLGGCDDAQKSALAELCYEVGIAFDMDYGVCGSGSYMSNAVSIYPDHFRYMNTVEVHERYEYSLYEWAAMIRQEIESSRPIQYQIYRHSIVCDGWREVLGQSQVHMNYGWGSSHNAWYTVDNLYCGWDGCSSDMEWMLTGIEPDRGVSFTHDVAWGQVPFDVSFSGVTTLEPDEWIWTFGDGESAYVQSPVHTYEGPGRFDVAARVVVGTDTSMYNRTNCIIALADTIFGGRISGGPGELVEVPVYVSNSVPLEKIKIPIEYGQGSMDVSLESYSKVGCRTEYFDTLAMIHSDLWGQRATFTLYNLLPAAPDLAAGSGPVLKLYFRIPAGASSSQSAPIIVDGYMTHFPTFYWDVLDFSPILENGIITLPYMCGDVTVDGSRNLLDILFLIEYIYGNPRGPAPEPLNSGDVTGDGTVNLLDVLYLIDFIYGNPPGPAPACP